MKTKEAEVKRVINEVISLLNREKVTHLALDNQRETGEIDVVIIYTTRIIQSSATPSAPGGGSGGGARPDDGSGA